MIGRRPRAAARAEEKLSPAAVTFRTVHAGIAVGFLAAIVHVWVCALSGRRGPALRVAVAALAAEGLVVIANGGDCPLGGVQDRLGDPVPLFELVLSPRAAHLAIPALGAIAATGVALLARGAGIRGIPSLRCGPSPMRPTRADPMLDA